MQIVPYLLLMLSVCLETGKNVFSGSFCKNVLKNETDIYKFNFFLYSGSFFVLLPFGGWQGSVYSVLLSALFALSLFLNQHFFLKALACGAVSFTNFIQCTSLLLPVLFAAIIWRDNPENRITPLQIVLMAVLILSFIPTLNIGRQKLNLRWFFYSVCAMLALGAIGILQAVHQASAYSGELVFFLRHAFFFAVVIHFFGWQLCRRRQTSNFSIRSRAFVGAAASGAFMGGVHMLNLYLVGKLPYVVLFPTLNGGLIFLTLLCDMLFFGQRLSKKQWLGILIGTAALCMIDL